MSPYLLLAMVENESVAAPLRYEVIKTYPQRGSLQQYRLRASTSFPCFRCGDVKTSKLVTVFRDDWNHLLCNACYGRLLSIHEVRAGDGPTEEKAEALASRLVELVPADVARRSQELMLVRERRTEGLRAQTRRLLATADYVATQLACATDLDWSAAVIGLCKAVEVELVSRLLNPLAQVCEALDLREDINDKDMGRVARYCSGRVSTAPELGAIGHFLQTAANSKKRQASSELIGQFRGLIRRWPHSDRLVAEAYLSSINLLTTRFRNPAAHTGELSHQDYDEAFELVAGRSGILWELIRSTQSSSEIAASGGA